MKYIHEYLLKLSMNRIKYLKWSSDFIGSRPQISVCIRASSLLVCVKDILNIYIF